MSRPPRPSPRDRLDRHLSSAPARALAWLALLLVTGFVAREEVVGSDVPAGVLLTSDVVYRTTPSGRFRLDIYQPKGPAPRGGRPAVIAIHGGGWRGGSKADFGRDLAPLVRSGLVVVAVDYRLSRPGSPSWPGNLDDVRTAVRWVDEHAETYGIDRGRLALLGASAGAHLALMAGLTPTSGVTAPQTFRNRSRPTIRAVVDFFGPSDLAALATSETGVGQPVEFMLGARPADDPALYRAASPVSNVHADSPAVLLLHGTDDYLIPWAQSSRLAAALKEAGVPHRFLLIDGGRHGFGLEVNGRDLTAEVLEFLRASWKDE